MTKHILLSVLVLLACGNSQAANWVRLGDTGSSKLMLDKQSVLQQDIYKKAWVKVEYKKPQTNPDTLDTQYNSSKLLWLFDCTAQKSATSQVFQYLNNTLVYSAGVDVKNAEFIEPVPESDVDIAMRYVCLEKKPILAEPTVKPEKTKGAEAIPEGSKPADPKPADSKQSEPKTIDAKTTESKKPEEAENKPTELSKAEKR